MNAGRKPFAHEVAEPIHISVIQKWLEHDHLTGLVVPSTDEFLSEFAPPANRRLRWATGFRGSTGLGVILQEHAALFLDGRYRTQAAADVKDTSLAVEPMTREGLRAWLNRSLTSGARLGLNPALHTMPEVRQWQAVARELDFELVMLDQYPVDRLWEGRPPEHRPSIVPYPLQYAGESPAEKCAALIEHLRQADLHAMLVADPEDVSWLLNVRADAEVLKTPVDDWHIVPSCASCALVEKDSGITWFVDEDRLGSSLKGSLQGIRVEAPAKLATTLHDAARVGKIGVPLQRTPAVFVAAIDQAGGMIVSDDAVARRRWRKHPIEQAAARRVHLVDSAAVVRCMAALTHAVSERTVSEIDAAEMLHAFRVEHPDYQGPSEPYFSASGLSGAEPHYIPRRQTARRLNDHPIYWMDSGGQYLGGSTDNTFTLAVGIPEPKHIQAHTLVLKGYIALATVRFPCGTQAFRLDTLARQALWQEGLDYPHGTGHGVGNYLNIHEGPAIRAEVRPISAVALEPGMIVTNEPGYYAVGDFGLRIESHMIVVKSPRHPDFLEFETISRLPIDPHLVDFRCLSNDERQWLATYHRTVLQDLEPLLDESSAAWLRALAQAFCETHKPTADADAHVIAGGRCD